MPNTPSIEFPARFVSATAIGFASGDDALSLVRSGEPLPVRMAAAATTTNAGTLVASEQIGPFAAQSGQVLVVQLAGDWQGRVDVLRSIDGGASKHVLRVGGEEWGVFTKSGVEQVWFETQDGTEFYLDVNLFSGTLSYEVSR